MRPSLFCLRFAGLLLACAWTADRIRAADTEGVEFFEKRIRPLLAERCYECHSDDKKVKGGLALDTPEGLKLGGDSGPAIAPGNVDGSRLIRAVRSVDPEVEAMPPKSALPREEIALLEEWIRRGAPLPE